MGVAIIFGLSVATFLTLIVVPTIFISVSNLKEKFRRKPKEVRVEILPQE